MPERNMPEVFYLSQCEVFYEFHDGWAAIIRHIYGWLLIVGEQEIEKAVYSASSIEEAKTILEGLNDGINPDG